MEQKHLLFDQEENPSPPRKTTRKKTIKSTLSIDNFLIAHNFLHPFKIKIILLLTLFVIISLATLAFNNLTIDSKTITLGFENIGELATQSGYYTNVQIISDDQKVFGVHVPFTQSKSIFSYDGIIKVGYDFTEIGVDIDNITKVIAITLPEPSILSNQVDYESLEVYDESVSIFTPLSLEANNESLIKLTQESEQTAIDNGILEDARINAQHLITIMLANTAQLQDYEIVFK